MKRVFDIDWAANKDVPNNKSVVAFSAICQDDPSVQYSGTFVVNSTDDKDIYRSFDWHLADHIRLDKEVNQYARTN